MEGMVFTGILEKVQRAARNCERLHLDVDQVRALVRSPLYATLTELHAEELDTSWRNQPTASRSGNSGSTTAKSEMTGASAGTTDPLVQDAESQLALEEANRTIHLSRRNKRSQSIMRITPARKSPSSPPTLASHRS